MLKSSSRPDSGERHAPVSNHTRSSPSGVATRPRTKGRETELRHQKERRDDRLSDIRAQIADGSLVVRQMTAAERADGYNARSAGAR
jgi:hypothetical protein